MDAYMAWQEREAAQELLDAMRAKRERFDPDRAVHTAESVRAEARAEALRYLGGVASEEDIAVFSVGYLAGELARFRRWAERQKT